MTTSLKIRQGLGPLGDRCFDPYWQRALGRVIMIRGLWWWQQGGPGAGYCQCHHHCQGVITEHSSGCISAANIIIFLLQHNEERNVIRFYWHCALFLISQYGEDERSPGPGKCSVRILWHLLTFIPRAPVSDQLSSASGPVMASLNHPVISRQMFGW